MIYILKTLLALLLKISQNISYQETISSLIITTKFLFQIRLHTYLRASMGQKRFSALSFLHINYDTNVDIDNVNDLFAKKKEKAMKFVNICDIISD